MFDRISLANKWENEWGNKELIELDCFVIEFGLASEWEMKWGR